MLYIKSDINNYKRYIDYIYRNSDDNINIYQYDKNNMNQEIVVPDMFVAGSQELVSAFNHEFLKDLEMEYQGIDPGILYEEYIDQTPIQVYLVDKSFQKNHSYKLEFLNEVANRSVKSFIKDDNRVVVIKGNSETEITEILSKVDSSILTKDHEELFEVENKDTLFEQRVKEIAIKNNNLEDTGEQRIVYFEADPTKGYNYPYVLVLPSDEFKSVSQGHKRYLIVEPNNTGTTTNNYEVHLKDVITNYYGTVPGGYLSEQLNLPRLIPIFPRPYLTNENSEIYTHSLDSTTVFLEDIYETLSSPNNAHWNVEDTKKLFDLEEQMYNMIEDAKMRLNNAGYGIEEKVFMVGFSASGNFVNRYSSIYPEQLKAIYAGGISGNVLLPAIEYKGKELIYPIGMANHEYLFNKKVNIDAFNKVARIYYLGGEDDNNPFDFRSPFDDDERELIFTLFGEEAYPDRWQNIQEAYQEVGGKGLFLLNSEKGHGMGNEDREFVLEFFKDNRDSNNPVYRKTSKYDILEINVFE